MAAKRLRIETEVTAGGHKSKTRVFSLDDVTLSPATLVKGIIDGMVAEEQAIGIPLTTPFTFWAKIEEISDDDAEAVR